MTIEKSHARASNREARNSYALVLRTLKFLKPVRGTALIAALVVLARIAVEIPTVYFLSPAVTTVIKGFSGGHSSVGFFHWILSTDPTAAGLRRIIAYMGAAQLCLGLMIWMRSIWDTKLSMRAVFHIRNAIYDHLQHVGFPFHDKMTSGQLINRALSDLQSVRNFVNTSVISTLDITATVAAYLGLLYCRSPWLMLAALLPLPFWWFLISGFNRTSQVFYRAQQGACDSLMSALTENVGGVQVIRAFGLEKREMRKYARLNTRLLDRQDRMVDIQSRLTPSLKAVAAGAHVLLFVIASRFVIRQKLNIGDLLILGMAMGAILSKLQQVSVIIEVYQKGIVSARRLFEVLDTPRWRDLTDEPSQFQWRGGEIEFDDVTFGYDFEQCRGRPILHDISFKIPANQVTAIIGKTGSGKSTLGGLIARFYDPQKGAIRVDGHDLKSIELKELRHTVGYVFQETFLFSDTIRNNIRYGRLDVSDEMLYSAAKAAHAHEFIQSLPNGYDTILGDGGVNLSGGQRQRLALARALVYDPKILILDDATAALDPKTERSVQESLEELFENRTVLMITSRVSAVQCADHVIVLEEGRISQTGNHQDLARAEGTYQEILHTQLGHTQLEEVIPV
ncbi:MAG: ABC transporter ATP-binding protein [Bdellovibrionia bacterium]